MLHSAYFTAGLMYVCVCIRIMKDNINLAESDWILRSFQNKGTENCGYITSRSTSLQTNYVPKLLSELYGHCVKQSDKWNVCAYYIFQI